MIRLYYISLQSTCTYHISLQSTCMTHLCTFDYKKKAKMSEITTYCRLEPQFQQAKKVLKMFIFLRRPLEMVMDE